MLSGLEGWRVELARGTWTRGKRQSVSEFKVKLAFSLSSIGVPPVHSREGFATEARRGGPVRRSFSEVGSRNRRDAVSAYRRLIS